VHSRSLVPGGYGVFRATGTPNGPAFAIFGAPAAMSFPLYPVLPMPGCDCHLDLAAGLVLLPAIFEPEINPQPVGASAEVLLRIPPTAAVFGLELATQWLDLLQMATSNGVHWRIGTALPQLDMALVEGHPSVATGTVTNYLAHVFRFEYQ
jgi:hypothetical protein